VTSQGVVQSPSITKYGHKIQWLNTWLRCHNRISKSCNP